MGCVGSAILLLLVPVWIPFIGPFFSLLTPLPFLYYTTKLGLPQGLKVVALTLLIVGLVAKLAGFIQIIFLCLEFSLLGLIISEIYRRKLTFGLTIFWGTCSMLLLGAIFLFLIALTKKMGPLELMLKYFQTNLGEAISAYENRGLSQEDVSQLREYSKLVTNIISMIYPALMITGTGFVVWVNVVISRPLFRMGNLNYPDFGPMDRWHAPEPMIWGVIVAGFSLFLPIHVIKLLAVNALIVMAIIYVFHGVSIVLYFLNKYHIPVWMRIGAYALIILQQIFWVGLAMAGLFDQWIDFRKIYKKAAS
jgi:uncharacterized protein YybS (DUF2232 family)